MKLLHINCNYVGTTLHQTMVEALEENNIHNSVFVPVYNKDIATITVNDYVHVVECFRKFDRVCFYYKQLKIQRALEKIETVENYDLIHAYTVFTDGNTARVLSKKYNKPYVVAVRNTDVNTFFKYMIHMRRRGVQILKDASAIFFLTSKYKEIIFEKYLNEEDKKIIEEKSFVIPNGIDEFWLENRTVKTKKAFEERKLKLCYAGKINRNKNILQIVKAMKCLEEKHHIPSSLTIVGKIEDQAYFNEIMNDGSGRVEYLEACPKERLIEVYRAHDLFVMPSIYETFGLVYAEAMSQGLPVIYTKGQGFDGQFAEGRVGYHTEANNTEMLVEVILKIMERYLEISEVCSDMSTKFNWGNISLEYVAQYERILKK